MSANREQQVTEAFVVPGQQPGRRLRRRGPAQRAHGRLRTAARHRLRRRAPGGRPGACCTWSPRPRSDAPDLELFQLQRAEGPCLDCFRDGRGRWSRPGPRRRPPTGGRSSPPEAAREVGYAARARAPHAAAATTVLGALGLFGASPGPLRAEDDLVPRPGPGRTSPCVAIVQRAGSPPTARPINAAAPRPHRTSRASSIEQAKGDPRRTPAASTWTVAFAALRRYARDHQSAG